MKSNLMRALRFLDVGKMRLRQSVNVLREDTQFIAQRVEVVAGLWRSSHISSAVPRGCSKTKSIPTMAATRDIDIL